MKRFWELNEGGEIPIAIGIILPKREGGMRPYKAVRLYERLVRPYKGLIRLCLKVCLWGLMSLMQPFQAGGAPTLGTGAPTAKKSP